MKYSKTLFGDIFTSEQASNFNRHKNIIPNPDKILRKTGNTIEAYRELKNDTHLWSCIQSRKSGVLSLDYRILQNKCTDFTYKLVKKALEKIDLQGLIRDILEAPLFGYQPLEIIWDYDNNNQTKIIPVNIIAKAQENFFFNSQGNLVFIKSFTDDPIEPEKYKILDVRYEATHLNPYGHSLLSKCYWTLTFKMLL